MYQGRAVAARVFVWRPVQLVENPEELAMKVLVVSDPGYIRAVPIPFLRAAGHEDQGK